MALTFVFVMPLVYARISSDVNYFGRGKFSLFSLPSRPVTISS